MRVKRILYATYTSEDQDTIDRKTFMSRRKRPEIGYHTYINDGQRQGKHTFVIDVSRIDVLENIISIS